MIVIGPNGPKQHSSNQRKQQYLAGKWNKEVMLIALWSLRIIFIDPNNVLSRATCSARSLNFTVSNCQGPGLLGGIGMEGGTVESRQDRGSNEENDSEGGKGRFQIVEGRCVSYTVFVRGEVRSVISFLDHQPPGSTFWSNTFWLERHKTIKVVIYVQPVFGLTCSSYLPYKIMPNLYKL
jgi:hypothetical protein